MAKLQCVSVPGLELWFWSNDHEPPHFHAKRKGEWEAKVKFMESRANMIEVKKVFKKGGMSKADKRALQLAVENHRLEILKEWELKVQQP